MIPREILKKICQIQNRTNRFALVSVALTGVLFGCSSIKPNLNSTINYAAVKYYDGIALPRKFKSYHEFYDFAARLEGVSVTNSEVLLKFAADTSTEIITVDDRAMQDQYLYLIEPHYLNGGVYDQIRGAQGNGGYYVLRLLATNFTGLDTDKGFELVGLLAGNSCRFTHETGKPTFITHWHMSAAESPQTIYEWNGKFFEAQK